MVSYMWKLTHLHARPVLRSPYRHREAEVGQATTMWKLLPLSEMARRCGTPNAIFGVSLPPWCISHAGPVADQPIATLDLSLGRREEDNTGSQYAHIEALSLLILPGPIVKAMGGREYASRLNTRLSRAKLSSQPIYIAALWQQYPPICHEALRSVAWFSEYSANVGMLASQKKHLAAQFLQFSPSICYLFLSAVQSTQGKASCRFRGWNRLALFLALAARI
jgi:hypothetical protein